MAETFTHTMLFDVVTCGAKPNGVNCGAIFGLLSDVHATLRRDGRSFYCPQGHSISYTETEEARQRRRADAADAAARAEKTATQFWMDRARREEKTTHALRGHLTRIKRRVGNGVCPCCRREFQNLKRHIAGQHPDFTPEPSNG